MRWAARGHGQEGCGLLGGRAGGAQQAVMLVPVCMHTSASHTSPQAALPHPFMCAMSYLPPPLPGPMLGALAAGLREARGRALVGPALQLDGFLDAMLRRLAPRGGGVA